MMRATSPRGLRRTPTPTPPSGGGSQRKASGLAGKRLAGTGEGNAAVPNPQERVREYPTGTPIVAGTARVLILDIERLPGQASVPFWDLGDFKNRRIHADHVVEWPRTICAAWRWYGNKRVEFAAEWGKGGRQRMLERTWAAYDQADIVVGHNLKNFDSKKLKGDWKLAGLPSPRPWKTVDTLTVARQEFGFESNTLDALCRRFGLDGKIDRYDPRVAADACAGNREAQRRIRIYNQADVEQTEMFYDELRGSIPNHPHVGSFGDTVRCNQCGSADLTLQPTRYRAVLIDYALYRCDNCGANVRGGWHARAASTRGVR